MQRGPPRFVVFGFGFVLGLVAANKVANAGEV